MSEPLGIGRSLGVGVPRTSICMAMTRSDRRLVGSSGEHFVCSALAQQGWAASLTREGVAHADVLAVRGAVGRQMIEVQVKTVSFSRKPSWPMGANWLASAESEHEWYAFLVLGEDVERRPRCFLVPRDHAVAAAWISHEDWRTEPKVPAGRRQAPVVRARVGLRAFLRYEERWDLLEKATGQVPVLLPRRFRGLLHEPRIAFPPWHPWSVEPPSDWPLDDVRNDVLRGIAQLHTRNLSVMPGYFGFGLATLGPATVCGGLELDHDTARAVVNSLVEDGLLRKTKNGCVLTQEGVLAALHASAFSWGCRWA
jgi:hypothetical protein